MPTVSAGDLATLRTSPQYSRLGLLVFRPPTIASGQVSGSPSQGSTTITLSSFSQTEAPEQHFSVIAGSAAGLDDGGKTRLLSIASNVLTLADNNIEWTTYPYVSVLRVIEPWSILPNVQNDTIDGTPYVDENTEYHPLGRIGPPVFGYVNEAVKFHSDSTVVAGGGCAISAHSWSFPSGSPSSSSVAGSVGSPINVTWSAVTGHVPHYLKYIVTDTNGKTHNRYNPVWVLNEFEDAYCDFEIQGLSGDYGAGTWSTEITVHGDASPDEFPQDAMIVIISEDYYAGLKASIGGNWAYRENVLFTGWIIRDTVFKDDETGNVSFEVTGPVGKLDQLLSWPANFEFVNDFTGTWGCTTTSWQEFSGMTSDRVGFHLLTVRSTLDHICDVYLTGNTKFLRYVDIPETTLRDQLDNYALSPIGARVLSNRQGQLYFSRNPNLRPESERSGIADVMTLLLDDIRADPGFDLGEEEHEPQAAQVDFIGFNYSGAEVTPLYSLAPETQYHTGDIERVDGIRVDSQSEANTLAGLYLANFNNIWREVQTPTFNYRIFDIVPEEYIRLTLAASDTKRGIVWSSQKLICRSISIGIEAEAILVNPTFEKDSLGPAGITGFYPTDIPQADPTLPDAPGQALALFESFYFRRSGGSWELRDCVPELNHGCKDPWWFHPNKANSLDPDKAAFVGVGDNGLITVSDLDGGYNWSGRTISDPPNTWSDSPAPTIDDIDFVWVGGDNWRFNRFYALARWQNGSSQWRSWLLYTDTNWNSSTWVELDDGVTLPDQTYAWWAAVNGLYALITIWRDVSSTYTQRLLSFSTLSFLFDRDEDLGTTVSDPTSAERVFPVTVLDNDDVWYVAGLMDTPLGLSGQQIHIARSLNAGGVWEIVEKKWGTNGCRALEVGDENPATNLRKHWAVRG